MRSSFPSQQSEPGSLEITASLSDRRARREAELPQPRCPDAWSPGHLDGADEATASESTSVPKAVVLGTELQIRPEVDSTKVQRRWTIFPRRGAVLVTTQMGLHDWACVGDGALRDL